MRRPIALLFACLALGLVAAGCGGGNSNKSSNSNGNSGGGTSSNTDTTTQPAPKAGAGAVTMQGIKFNPTTVTVKAGETVTWTNDDSVGHDVTGPGFKSGAAGGLAQGATFQHKFPKKGTYAYVCSVHPGMKGTVKVR
jgi:plastocyanin